MRQRATGGIFAFKRVATAANIDGDAGIHVILPDNSTIRAIQEPDQEAIRRAAPTELDLIESPNSRPVLLYCKPADAARINSGDVLRITLLSGEIERFRVAMKRPNTDMLETFTVLGFAGAT